MLNIAKHPAANVAGLFALAGTYPAYPGLSTQPNDWTLSIAYNNSGGLLAPNIPAVDAAGNVWFPNSNQINGPATATELSPLGVPTPEYVAPGGIPASQVAIDPIGNPWFAFAGNGFVAKVLPSSQTVQYFYYNGTPGSDDGHQIAIDASGNVYISDYTAGTIKKLTNSGTPASGFNFPTTTGYHNIAFVNATDFYTLGSNNLSGYEFTLNGVQDSSAGRCGSGLLTCGQQYSTAHASTSNGYLWNYDTASNLLNQFSPSANSETTYAFGGGLNIGTASQQPTVWLAIDGGNNVWVPNYGSSGMPGSLSEFSNTGTPLSPATTGFVPSAACAAKGLAIDGSGDVWVSCDSAATPVVEFIGAAVPVYTPITPGQLAVKP